MSTRPPLDEATISQLFESVGSDPAFLDELADAYLADAPEQLAAARAAVAAGSPDDVVRPAHTLKSSSSTFGAQALAGLARELELQARAGSLDGAAAGLDAAEAEFAAVSSALAERRRVGWSSSSGGS
ncbi:MAG: Hpt domain-containing protein [Chloroflexota bacterium]|nr:Hpt domain-containing protein [Chloroflexota bacterium]